MHFHAEVVRLRAEIITIRTTALADRYEMLRFKQELDTCKRLQMILQAELTICREQQR